MMISLSLFLFLFLFFVSLVFAISIQIDQAPSVSDDTSNNNGTYSFIILSDLHIGDVTANATAKAKSTVQTVNQLLANGTTNLKMVLITGDLTNSATDDQYATVKSILDKLQVPYYPGIGNHDTWPYNATWETEQPVGDQKFAQIFQDVLKRPEITLYPNGIVWNPQEQTPSWFQNFYFKVGNNVYIFLDWNSRHAAVSQLGYSGAMPGAELHDFEGGTFPWFSQVLTTLNKESISLNVTYRVILFQHQPFRSWWPLPGTIYAFSESQNKQVVALLSQFKALNYWGVFAGHFHHWLNGTAFDDMDLLLWETAATKEPCGFTLVTCSEKTDEILLIEEKYADVCV